MHMLIFTVASTLCILYAVVVIRIEGESTRSVAEGDSIDICVSKNIQSIRDVNFALTPVPRTAGGMFVYIERIIAIFALL